MAKRKSNTAAPSVEVPRLVRPDLLMDDLTPLPLAMWDVVSGKCPRIGNDETFGFVRRVAFRSEMDVTGVIDTVFFDYVVLTSSSTPYPMSVPCGPTLASGSREFKVTFKERLKGNQASLRSTLKRHLKEMANCWANDEMTSPHNERK